jgi:hypothetical protein
MVENPNAVILRMSNNSKKLLKMNEKELYGQRKKLYK